jgi:hypothetical protein
MAAHSSYRCSCSRSSGVRGLRMGCRKVKLPGTRVGEAERQAAWRAVNESANSRLMTTRCVRWRPHGTASCNGASGSSSRRASMSDPSWALEARRVWRSPRAPCALSPSFGQRGLGGFTRRVAVVVVVPVFGRERYIDASHRTVLAWRARSGARERLSDRLTRASRPASRRCAAPAALWLWARNAIRHPPRR